MTLVVQDNLTAHGKWEGIRERPYRLDARWNKWYSDVHRVLHGQCSSFLWRSASRSDTARLEGSPGGAGGHHHLALAAAAHLSATDRFQIDLRGAGRGGLAADAVTPRHDAALPSHDQNKRKAGGACARDRFKLASSAHQSHQSGAFRPRPAGRQWHSVAGCSA